MPDPEPVINAYRVCTFVIFIASGLMLMQVIPQVVKDWLPVLSLVVSGALTIFFKVNEAAPANRSIAQRVADKASGSK